MYGESSRGQLGRECGQVVGGEQQVDGGMVGHGDGGVGSRSNTKFRTSIHSGNILSSKMRLCIPNQIR